MGGPAESQLDLMFIDNVDLVESSAVLPPVADHCPTIMQLRLSRPREHGRQCTFRDFERGNLSGLTNFLLNVDWSLVYSAQDPEVALDIWYDIFLSAVNRFVPETTVTIRPNNKHWYTAHLHRLCRQRDRVCSVVAKVSLPNIACMRCTEEFATGMYQSLDMRNDRTTAECNVTSQIVNSETTHTGGGQLRRLPVVFSLMTRYLLREAMA